MSHISTLSTVAARAVDLVRETAIQVRDGAPLTVALRLYRESACAKLAALRMALHHAELAGDAERMRAVTVAHLDQRYEAFAVGALADEDVRALREGLKLAAEAFRGASVREGAGMQEIGGE